MSKAEQDYHFAGAATTLEEAHTAFEWRNRPRMTDEELQRLYQRRTTHRNLEALLRQLKSSVVSSRSWLYALYIGPSGCGKSTDLTWLVTKIERDPALAEPLLIIHYGIGDAVGAHDVGFAEVALSMMLEVYSTLQEAGITFAYPEYRDKIGDWLFGEEETTKLKEREAKGEAGISLLSRLKGSLRSRTVLQSQVKVRLQRLLPELLGLFSGLLEKVREITGKEIIFVVDDLEKITPVDTALGFFLNTGGFFSGLPCHQIFTAPSALRLDKRYRVEVLRHFREYLALLSRPEAEGEMLPELDVLRRLIYRRMAPALAEEKAIDRAICMTGGVLSDLVEVLQRSLLMALTDGCERLAENHVEEALKEVAAALFAVLDESDYVALDRVERGEARSSDETPELLHCLVVLEYPNSQSIFVVHPLVRPFLERWRERQAVSQAER